MDKELYENQLPTSTRKVLIQVNKSNLPGNDAYTGRVRFRQVMDIAKLAKCAASKNRIYSADLMASVFRLMADEIYEAIEEGFNVDIGVGRLELTVRGAFNNPNARPDRNEHVVQPNFVPSPQLKQRVANLKCINDSRDIFKPRLMYINGENQYYPEGNPLLVNKLQMGTYPVLFLFGQKLKLEGEHPDVGLRFLSPAGEEYRYTTANMLYNTPSHLVFRPTFDLTPGLWTCTVCTQYNPSSRPYKQPRTGTLSFTVRDATDTQ